MANWRQMTQITGSYKKKKKMPFERHEICKNFRSHTYVCVIKCKTNVSSWEKQQRHFHNNRIHSSNVTRTENMNKLEMWANAQCDCHPAEYRWRPLFNAAKFG